VTTFFLVRHGATKLNNSTDASQDMIRGWSDVPLSDEGREHAKETAERLKGKGIQVLISSNLSRARETAEIIGKVIGVRPQFSQELRPWNLGELTGKSTEDALPRIRAYIEAPTQKVPQGESFDTFKDRAFSGLADCLDIAAGRKLCVVTHHRLERLVKAWIAVGQPVDGEVDPGVFSQKGEPPGNVEVISIDDAKLRKVRGEPMRGAIQRAVSEVKAHGRR
jgi:broad specificity phosphatase PhoE